MIIYHVLITYTKDYRIEEQVIFIYMYNNSSNKKANTLYRSPETMSNTITKVAECSVTRRGVVASVALTNERKEKNEALKKEFLFCQGDCVVTVQAMK